MGEGVAVRGMGRIAGMRILVIGSGAREHALLYAFSKDPQVAAPVDGGPSPDLHVAPGNAGMSSLATLHSVKVDDPAACAALAKEIDPELVVIGPEVPLVAGVGEPFVRRVSRCSGRTRMRRGLRGRRRSRRT